MVRNSYGYSLAIFIIFAGAACTDSEEPEPLTTEELMACQNADEPCEAPVASTPAMNCCPISETLSAGYEHFGASYQPNATGTFGYDVACRQGYLDEDPELDDFTLTRNEVGCLRWQPSWREPVPAGPDTSSYDDEEMFACQNAEQPCPSPTTPGIFCCPIQADPGCGCSELGGAYDPDGSVFRSGYGCGGICDATYPNYRMERDDYGCLRGVSDPDDGSCWDFAE